MSTVKLYCKFKQLADVMADMMKSGVKYYPVRRHMMNHGMGYILEMDAKHPIVSFLVLKFGLEQVE